MENLRIVWISSSGLVFLKVLSYLNDPMKLFFLLLSVGKKAHARAYCHEFSGQMCLYTF